MSGVIKNAVGFLVLEIAFVLGASAIVIFLCKPSEVNQKHDSKLLPTEEVKNSLVPVKN